MKKLGFCVLFFTAVWLVAAAANVSAGENASLNVLGFSPDGKYLAFEEYGTYDATDASYASLYLVETEKNVLIGRPFYAETAWGKEREALKKVESLAAVRLRALKIVRGNTGRLVVNRLITDLPNALALGDEPTTTRKLKFNDSVNLIAAGYDYYELTLKLIKTDDAACTEEDFTYYRIELLLDHYTQEKSDLPTQVLQKDERLPKSRNCPYNYRIESVYLYKDRIAVFLNTILKAWEGASLRYMVVTGNFKRAE